MEIKLDAHQVVFKIKVTHVLEQLELVQYVRQHAETESLQDQNNAIMETKPDAQLIVPQILDISVQKFWDKYQSVATHAVTQSELELNNVIMGLN
jgi:hypothetical protein